MMRPLLLYRSKFVAVIKHGSFVTIRNAASVISARSGNWAVDCGPPDSLQGRAARLRWVRGVPGSARPKQYATSLPVIRISQSHRWLIQRVHAGRREDSLCVGGRRFVIKKGCNRTRHSMTASRREK